MEPPRDENREWDEGDLGVGKPEEPLRTREGTNRLSLSLLPIHVDMKPQSMFQKPQKAHDDDDIIV